MAKSRKPAGTVWTHDEMRLALRLRDLGLMTWEQIATAVGRPGQSKGLGALVDHYAKKWGPAGSPDTPPVLTRGSTLEGTPTVLDIGILGAKRYWNLRRLYEYPRYISAQKHRTDQRAHLEQTGREPAASKASRYTEYERYALWAADAELASPNPCAVCETPVDDTLSPCPRCTSWVHDDCQVAHICPGDPLAAQRYEEPDDWEAPPVPLHELEFLPYTRELAGIVGPFIGDIGERSSPPVERDLAGHRRARRNGVKYGRVPYRCPRCGLEWVPPPRTKRELEREPVTCPRGCRGIHPRPLTVSTNGHRGLSTATS
jgi:hypothetical protein